MWLWSEHCLARGHHQEEIGRQVFHFQRICFCKFSKFLKSNSKRPPVVTPMCLWPFKLGLQKLSTPNSQEFFIRISWIKLVHTLCSEKKPTHVFFYISMENVRIFTKFSGNVQEETSIPPVNKLDILCYRWHHVDIIFPYLYIMGFTVEDRYWWNVKTDQLVIVLTEPENMLIPYTIFPFELFSWFIFLAECEILNFADVGKRMRSASLQEWPLGRYQSNDLMIRLIVAGHVSFFLFNHFIPSIFNCQCIVEKHLAQICCSITLADSQTFYQRYVFNGKTHSLEIRKYDASMMSLVAKNYLTFIPVEYLFPPEYSLKFLWKSERFPWRYKTKREWVFFSEHSIEKRSNKQHSPARLVQMLS